MTHYIEDGRENLGVAYFSLMREISGAVHEKILSYIEDGEQYKTEDLRNELMDIPKARAGKNIMRSALTLLMYRLNGGVGTILEILPALAVSELNNVNAYLDNIVFDDKKGIWRGGNTRRRISGITIASGIFRELTEKAVLDIPTSDVNKVAVLSSLCECMKKSYLGQYVDMKIGIAEVDFFENDQSYFDWYVEKSELQSGFLYGFSAKLGAILAGVDGDQIEKSEEIGKIIGLGVHVSNDLGDFAILSQQEESTGFKKPQDQMADLINGRLTFPIYHILKYGSSQERNIILDMVGNNHATQKELLEVIGVVHSSGAFDFGKKFIREYYKKARKLINSSFPASRERGMLKAMTSVIVSNKFLSALRDQK